MHATRIATLALLALLTAHAACTGARAPATDAGSGAQPLDASGDSAESGSVADVAPDGPPPDAEAPQDGSAEVEDGSGQHDAPGPDTATDAASTDAGDGAATDDAGPTGPCPSFGLPQRRGRLPAGITEASGLAVSRRDRRVLWVHNDSGDGPRVHAVNADTGALLGSVTLEADAVDWEDLSIGPCGNDVARECLVVADIGDNADRRGSVTLYRFVEPALADAAIVPQRLDIAYPDGPRDAESVFVGPDGAVYIVSKDDGSGGLYSVRWTGDPVASPVELTRHGAIDLSGLIAGGVELATGADFSVRYSRLLVRTYTSVIELRLEAGAELGTLVTAPYTTLPVGLELQGETVAWGPDGYFHVAEGSAAQIWEVRCSDAPPLP